MKITHLIGNCGAGGPSVFVKSLIIALKKMGVDVELWVLTKMNQLNTATLEQLQFEQTFLKELSTYEIKVSFVGKRLHKDWILSRKRLKDFFVSSKPNLIHSHSESPSFQLALALGFHQIPKVQTIHSSKILNPLIQKYFMSHIFKKYITVSDSVKSNLLNVISEKRKITVINNGIEIEKFQSLPFLAGRSIRNRPVKKLISVGRLSKAKDYPNLLKAFHELVAKLSQYNIAPPLLEVVGEGELRNELESLINELNLRMYVSFLGVREDIPNLLQSADIYVMGSEWEGMSISLLEALAAGIPIIATDAGGNRDIVENNLSGYIVPIKNSHALAEKLFELILDAKKRCFFSKNAYNRAKDFSIEISAQKHLEIYKELINHVNAS